LTTAVETGRRVYSAMTSRARGASAGCVDRKLAGEARGVGIEDARPDAPVGKQVDQKVSFGQVGGGVDALHLPVVLRSAPTRRR
jgi:hypothetical protein